MSTKHYGGAGDLRERPEILELKQTENGWSWEPVRKTWAAAELSTRKNVWSVHGIGAAGVEFIMRRQSLSLDHALRWKGQHCLITSIMPMGFNRLKVNAALVVLAQCEDKYFGTKFPGIVTEEYHRHEQLEPMAINVLRHVLVTPKCITLKPGKLVTVDGVDCPILTAHLFDPHQNEYVLERKVDL